MRTKYPSPRPTENQVVAAKCICNDYSIPLPEIEYMTKNQLGKWIREQREKHDNKIIAQISITQVITTYSDGRVSIDTDKRRLK